MAVFATASSGTRRSFPPLPRTMSMSAALRAAETGKATSSLTRNPVAYSTSQQAIQANPPQPLAGRPGGIADPVAGRREHAVDIRDGEHLGQRSAALRALDRRRRIVASMTLGIEKPIELAQCRQPPRDRGGRKGAGLDQRPQVGANVVTFRSCDRAAGRPKRGREIGEVAPIGGNRVHRRPALRRQHVEKQLDEPVVRGFVAPPHLLRRLNGASPMLVEPVLRDRHGDFARLRLDEHGQQHDPRRRRGRPAARERRTGGSGSASVIVESGRGHA